MLKISTNVSADNLLFDKNCYTIAGRKHVQRLYLVQMYSLYMVRVYLDKTALIIVNLEIKKQLRIYSLAKYVTT